jgi:hypothetical protein
MATLGPVHVDELAAHVAEACHLVDVPAAVEILEAGIAVGMHPALETGEVLCRVGAFPIKREAVERGGLSGAAPWALVARVGPQPGRLRLAGSGREQPHRGVVGVDSVASEDVPADCFGERLEQRAGLAYPVRDRQAVKIAALAGVIFPRFGGGLC